MSKEDNDKIPLTEQPLSSALEEIVNRERPTIIVLGEDHIYDEYSFTLISKFIEDAITKFGASNIAIYLETPQEDLYKLKMLPQFTSFHTFKLIEKHALARVGSSIESHHRNEKGAMDEEYATDIINVFSKFKTYPKKCVIALMGLMHCVEIFKRIPEKFDKYVYNVTGEKSIESLIKIEYAVITGEATRENYLSLRRLPTIINHKTEGGFRRNKKRMQRRKTRKARNTRKTK